MLRTTARTIHSKRAAAFSAPQVVFCSSKRAIPFHFSRNAARQTRRTSASHATTLQTKRAVIWSHIRERPFEYATIPCVAAFVGITTNWMGVKMLFYPIEYTGLNWLRWPDTPYGVLGWQGVVPTKTSQMATRLVNVVTERLLSLEESFGRCDAHVLSELLLPALEERIERDCGAAWGMILRPVLPILLPRILQQLQLEIDSVLDLHQIVLDAFCRDKIVLVDLFQKVGRVELEFLVNSGFGFGFLLGLGQMAAWVVAPRPWTLPVAGALVGYVTNWIAIKLLFEPAEPVSVAGLFEIQGLFESRQIEVSDEFGAFMNQRVLTASSLLEDLSNGGEDGELFAFLRRQLPFPIPSHVLLACVDAMQYVAVHPKEYPELHAYASRQMDIGPTLSRRLKLLSPTDFEDLLHPVFQEDEITLIMTGGVLGLLAGGAQTQMGWGGPGATRKAIVTIVGVLMSSAALYFHQKYEEQLDDPIESTERPQLRRQETIVRIKEDVPIPFLPADDKE